MADEYKITISGKFEKNDVKELFGYSNLTIDVTGKNYVKVTQTIGTTDETVAKGDIGTIGHVFIRNHDATNFVTWGADGTNYPGKVFAEDQAVSGFNGTDLHIKANTAACDCEVLIVEA